MLWIQGLDSNFLQNTPEQTTLRSIAQSRLNRALDDAKAMVEEQENAKKEEKSKVKKADKSSAADSPSDAKPASKKRGRPKKDKASEPVVDVDEEDPKED